MAYHHLVLPSTIFTAFKNILTFISIQIQQGFSQSWCHNLELSKKKYIFPMRERILLRFSNELFNREFQFPIGWQSRWKSIQLLQIHLQFARKKYKTNFPGMFDISSRFF